jgi:hypothetical protein
VRAMAAGDLLVTAKARVRHGQWLWWLRTHCHITVRTAQLYMSCARNRTLIGQHKAANGGVVGLNINEAGAIHRKSGASKAQYAFG